MNDKRFSKAPKLDKRAPDPPPPPWAVDKDNLLKSTKESIKLGLTGGIASGKSTLDELLVNSYGAQLIDFDIFAKEALLKDTEGYYKAIKLFGKKVVKKEDATLDRPLIASLIYKKPKLKKKLEDIVHPYTWKRMLEELSILKDQKLIVIDIPLLFEASLYTLFSPKVLCFATPTTQIERLLERNPNLNEQDAQKILQNQWAITQKIRLADYIINNNGQREDLIPQVKDLYDKLLERYT
jgi:dephospho-CoA kinase